MSPRGPIYLAATDEGLVYCSTPGGTYEEMAAWMGKKSSNSTLIQRDNVIIKTAKKQLREYFSGTGKVLDVPLKLIGTPFQLKCWNALAGVSYGKTRTYGQIAEEIGSPKGGRAVGHANHRNPVALFIP